MCCTILQRSRGSSGSAAVSSTWRSGGYDRSTRAGSSAPMLMMRHYPRRTNETGRGVTCKPVLQPPAQDYSILTHQCWLTRKAHQPCREASRRGKKAARNSLVKRHKHDHGSEKSKASTRPAPARGPTHNILRASLRNLALVSLFRKRAIAGIEGRFYCPPLKVRCKRCQAHTPYVFW